MAVAPKHMKDAAVGTTISIGGKPFVETGEPARMRYYNDEFGYFYAHLQKSNAGML